MNYSSSNNVYRQILKGLSDMDEKTLASQEGYFNLIKRIPSAMLRESEFVYTDVFAEDSDMTACTDSKVIKVNTWSPTSLSVLNLDRYLKSGEKNSWDNQLPEVTNTHQMMFLANVGLICHELGHCLYTNFLELNKIREDIRKGDFSIFKSQEKLEKLSKTKIKNVLISNIDFIINAVEDGYIENCLAMEYPHTGNCVRGLQMTKDMLFFGSQSMKEVEDGIAKGKILLPIAFINCVLIDCSRGYKMKDYDECAGTIHEIIDEAVKKARPIVKDYIENDKNHKQDICDLVEILVSLYPEPQENESSDEGKGEADSNSNEEGDSNSDESEQNKENDSNSKPNGKSKKSSKGSGSSKSTSQEIIDSQDIDDEEVVENSEKATEGINKDVNDSCTGRGIRRNPAEGLSKEEKKQKQKEANQAFENAKGNSSDEDFLKKMAKEISEDKKANAQTEKLKEAFREQNGYFKTQAQSIASIEQVDVCDADKRMYDMEFAPISSIAKSCSRKVEQLLKKRDFEDEDSGYAFGTRLVGRDVYRKDRKCFSKDLVPDDTPDVCFTIMVDESGSMSGKKIEKARQAAMLFDSVATSAKIPTRIVGHTTTSLSKAHIKNYRNFESNGKEKYSLINIGAHCSNVDTIVLTGLCEEILKRPEEKKVIIVISDGEPCDYNGKSKTNFKGLPFKSIGSKFNYQENLELNACVRYYRKKGVKIVGVALDDSEAIKAIYEEGTLDCSNLSRLPNEMMKLFKKYVLK